MKKKYIIFSPKAIIPQFGNSNAHEVGRVNGYFGIDILVV